MSADDRRFRLMTEHVDGTNGEPFDRYHEWVVDDVACPSMRDAIGRAIEGGGYRWGSLSCNNGDCPGRALYRIDVVEQEAAAWDERREVSS